jgi:uncharacterized damage-inducible protein DinB
MRDHFRRLFEYAAWANRRSLAAVRTMPDPAEGLRLFAHVLAAEHVWLSRLRGVAAVHPVWPTLTADECAGLLEENAGGYAGFLADADLGRVVRYTTTRGEEFETAAADMLTQAATHGGYHRGQIARVVAAAGGTPANTDFITFARRG